MLRIMSCDRWTLAEFDEEDEEGEYDDDEDRYGAGPLNIGKAFLIPRARMSLYDQDIFAPSLLEARDIVRLESFCFYCCSVCGLFSWLLCGTHFFRQRHRKRFYLFFGKTSADTPPPHASACCAIPEILLFLVGNLYCSPQSCTKSNTS